ncbi:hypothetical protein ACKF11_07755 [Methylobacillus sp. Pita2]|uniref:hypothetical protein n=1 Tax=unclassified Methylobacillus TaxID=2647660 RepID=UPI0038B5CF44
MKSRFHHQTLMNAVEDAHHHAGNKLQNSEDKGNEEEAIKSLKEASNPHDNGKPIKPDPEKPYTPVEPDEPDVQPEIIDEDEDGQGEKIAPPPEGFFLKENN